MEQPAENVTDLLSAWSAGDESAFQRLAPYVMPELRHIAAYYMRGERPGHLLQATALVNEAWLRLVDRHGQNWANRSHFFAVAARMMRHILIDYARNRDSAKHGCDGHRLPFEEALAIPQERSEYWLMLDEALQKLARADMRKSRVVELRFFLGMTVEEAAEVLGLSPNTVIREWRLAKAWLGREITSG